MKKAISLLCMLALLVCAVQTSAFADIVDPTRPSGGNGSMLPVVLIAVAVIVVAVVLWKVRKKKS